MKKFGLTPAKLALIGTAVVGVFLSRIVDRENTEEYVNKKIDELYHGVQAEARENNP